MSHGHAIKKNTDMYIQLEQKMTGLYLKERKQNFFLF